MTKQNSEIILHSPFSYPGKSDCAFHHLTTYCCMEHGGASQTKNSFWNHSFRLVSGFGSIRFLLNRMVLVWDIWKYCTLEHSARQHGGTVERVKDFFSSIYFYILCFVNRWWLIVWLIAWNLSHQQGSPHTILSGSCENTEYQIPKLDFDAPLFCKSWHTQTFMAHHSQARDHIFQQILHQSTVVINQQYNQAWPMTSTAADDKTEDKRAALGSEWHKLFVLFHYYWIIVKHNITFLTSSLIKNKRNWVKIRLNCPNKCIKLWL